MRQKNNINILIITSFQTYEPRAEAIRNYFEKKDKSVWIISTNFAHREKKNRSDQKDGYSFIATESYKRNLSLSRLISHYNFARDAFSEAEFFWPELLYVLIPANILVKFAQNYKHRKKCKLVIDIVDMWPESLPVSKIKNYWPFTLWRNLRNDYLCMSDAIITECDLYQQLIPLDKIERPIQTVYWPQVTYMCNIDSCPNMNIVRFLYLGSINNIIDIDEIIVILLKIKSIRPVELHIIGNGERWKFFKIALDKAQIPYFFWGIVYEHNTIQSIANQCHFGINIMKTTVCIGITMKSVSYLEMGLPILNNLKSDIGNLIEKYHCGFNVYSTSGLKSIDIIKEYGMDWRKNARIVYETYFSEDAIHSQLETIIDNVYCHVE